MTRRPAPHPNPLPARRGERGLVVVTLAFLAIAAYLTHASVHLARREPYDLLWICHLAALLVGFGVLFRWPTLNAIGFLWACFGTILWIIDLSTGGTLMPTSILTHVSGLIVGYVGIQKMGIPRGSAWKAVASYALVWVVTRILTPPAANVNLAFTVYSGWERWFPVYPLYLAMLLALAFALAATIERLA